MAEESFTGHRATSRVVEHGNVSIHYLDSDPDSTGEPVVFVPGLSDVAEDYRPVLGSFGRRTVVIDLRGRGRSSLPTQGFSRDDHISDLVAVLDDANIDAFHLATFSRGTAYSLPWALHHGHRVRSITIGDYVAGEVAFPGEGWPESFVSGRWRGEPVTKRISLEAVRGIAVESVERRYWKELEQAQPQLMVVAAGRMRGNGGLMLDEERKAEYKRAVPDVEIVVFETSGHDLFREDPHRYPRLVGEFANRCDSGRDDRRGACR